MSRVKLIKRVCDDFFEEVASELTLCGQGVLELMTYTEDLPVREGLRKALEGAFEV